MGAGEKSFPILEIGSPKPAAAYHPATLLWPLISSRMRMTAREVVPHEPWFRLVLLPLHHQLVLVIGRQVGPIVARSAETGEILLDE
jgi:hypothetical protein